jgi:hypothetical protein
MSTYVVMYFHYLSIRMLQKMSSYNVSELALLIPVVRMTIFDNIIRTRAR